MEVIRTRMLFRLTSFGGKEESILLCVIDIILWAIGKVTSGRVIFIVLELLRAAQHASHYSEWR